MEDKGSALNNRKSVSNLNLKRRVVYLRSHGLRDRANLIDFKQQAVAGLLLHGLADAIRVGHREVVSNHLDVGASCEVGPGRPVVLVKGILDGNH